MTSISLHILLTFSRFCIPKKVTFKGYECICLPRSETIGSTDRNEGQGEGGNDTLSPGDDLSALYPQLVPLCVLTGTALLNALDIWSLTPLIYILYGYLRVASLPRRGERGRIQWRYARRSIREKSCNALVTTSAAEAEATTRHNSRHVDRPLASARFIIPAADKITGLTSLIFSCSLHA